MKKQIITALTLILVSFATVQANQLTQINTTIAVTQEKVAVKPEDLPEAVKTTLATDAYAGWQVVGAFLVTKADNTQLYEVSLKNGEESATINFDKEGKKVE